MGDLPANKRIGSRVVFSAQRSPVSVLEDPLAQQEIPDFALERPQENSESSAHNASNIVLIDPKKISDFMRFRVMFVGMILFISSSTQGLHALFALYMEKVYMYDVRTMVDIFAAGTAFGLFVFPFGAMYDFFGPKIVIGIATAITSLSHLLFGLTFAGHIDASKTRFCIYFAMMNWGCYAFDVAALPAILTYAPRDRAQPTGVMKTFSGMGASLISCIFRGFFKNRYDHLMYFLMAIVLGFGLIGTFCLSNAPYEVTRWEDSRISLKERLRRHLIRNRYMSQLLPKRRFYILSFLLLIMNVYLSIQAICAAYFQKDMKQGQYRGIAVGAIAIVLCILFLLVPLHALDGDTPQDHTVLERAREKERKLAELRRLRLAREKEEKDAEGEEEGAQKAVTHPNAKEVAIDVKDLPRVLVDQSSPHAGGHSVLYDNSQQPSDGEKGYDDDDDEDNEEAQRRRYLPLDPEASLFEADDLIPMEGRDDDASRNSWQRLGNASIATRMSVSNVSLAAHRKDNEGAEMDVITRELSTYDRPHVETITVCGEVFVTPVYETSFLLSLTYVDLWLLFYTVFAVWGVGITLTANWNIRLMVGSVFKGLDYQTYVLFATLAGISTALGRVAIGGYEVLLLYIGKRRGVMLPATIAFPLPSVMLSLALIFYLSFPGNYSLLVVYIIAAIAYGFSTSMTIYVIGIIFKRDIGMHYGFCFLGAALGIVLLYRVLLFHVYDHHKLVLPPSFHKDTKGVCVGRECLQKTLIVYLILVFLSIGTSIWLHYRYWKLVHGKLKYKRVITHFVKKRLRRINRRIRETGHATEGGAKQQQQQQEQQQEEK
ncbi:hypothetical protein MOQ_003107 [Trypanosoma cruzi marinkellei]|uniref:Nodulin-like domain-containing protein n=1 Tax=Trypanosoma cruzi marinkellei TaxID=85056 RepID=K2MCW0_TRYCR|nr:hypothetical protein MOQ_003107 [Trypanosoma cruzi marinkellei]